MRNKTQTLFGAIEAGGTKFVCAVGTSVDKLIEKTVISTRSPDETLNDVFAFFSRQMHEHGPLSTIGVGSFGPIDINDQSATFGQITETPKPGWSGVNLVDRITSALDMPVVIDTDVNCALIAEAAYGAGKGIPDLVYLTIGTGIGGGIMSGSKLVYGNGHTEIGHIFVPKQEDDLAFSGACRYHGDRCIEGLACGPAIRKRWGLYSHEIPADHEAWDLEARYLAILCHNLLMTVAPRRIILGGGVMAQSHLFPLIRQKLHNLINGYGAISESCLDLENAILPPGLNGDAGVLGALEIARNFSARDDKTLKVSTQ